MKKNTLNDFQILFFIWISGNGAEGLDHFFSHVSTEETLVLMNDYTTYKDV